MKPVPARSALPPATGWSATPSPPANAAASPAPVVASWATHADEVREAQRLRYEVFAGELGAELPTALAHHDMDRYDDYCEHLTVRDAATRQVVGTYRVMLPAQARRAGSTYCDGEFDLAPLAALRPTMAELGRSCVHRDYRNGPVIMALWTALAGFMRSNHLETMIGCASMPLGGAQAASIWKRLRQTHLAPEALQVRPHLPLPLMEGSAAQRASPPALVQGYLRLGALVLGPPAWDPAFNTADLLMMMRMADLPQRYLREAAGG
jgi:putative hemolysin